MNEQGNTPSAPAEDFDTLKAKFAEEDSQTSEPVKRRGRPKGSKNASTTSKKDESAPIEIVDLIDAETVKAVVSFGFDVIATRKGEHWKLSPEEKENVGRLSTRVINKRGGEFLKQWGDEIALSVCVVMAVGARIQTDKRIAEEQKISAMVPTANG